jgi:hypothetical protein
VNACDALTVNINGEVANSNTSNDGIINTNNMLFMVVVYIGVTT